MKHDIIKEVLESLMGPSTEDRLSKKKKKKDSDQVQVIEIKVGTVDQKDLKERLQSQE